MSLGHHLRRLRDAAGLSPAELARRAAVPFGTLRLLRDLRRCPGPSSCRTPGR